jgi:hypothetical protein
MTKITADHLARQGAFVTATHTLRGKSGKESPGDKSFIPAKGIKLTKIGERSNSNVAYADERDIAGHFCDEIPVEQCLPFASGGGLPVHNSRRVPTARSGCTAHMWRPSIIAGQRNSELVLPMKVAKKKGRAA